MLQDLYKKNSVHLLAFLIFVVLSYAYFPPIFSGKEIRQSDIVHFKGMSKELVDYRAEHEEEGLWSNSMFGGMPSYLTTVYYPNNMLKFLSPLITLFNTKPVSHVFLYLLSFYICLLAFGVNPWLSIAGAIGFGFSSYFFIIIEAGHVTKAIAIGCMPAIIGGILFSARGQFIKGGLIFAYFLTMQLASRHLQITYYTVMVIFLLGVALLYRYIKEKNYKTMWRALAALAVGGVLAIGVNFPNLYLINEYGKLSMRGKSDLKEQVQEGDQTSGLDRSYITAWSYGISETWTLLIPNFNGGGASDSYDYSDFYKENFDKFKAYFMQQGYPVKDAEEIAKQQIGARFYWGDQAFTSGPVYVGAIVCMLFVLGLFVVDGAIKWWLVSATLLSFLLAWGRHFMWFTDIFLDYLPGYNKFRTVSMILVIAEFTMPLLGILGLNAIISGTAKPFKSSVPAINSMVFSKLKFTNNDGLNYTIFATAITGLIALFFALFGTAMFDFGAAKMGTGQMSLDILDARKQVFVADCWRTLLFIVLAGGAIATYCLGKLNLVRFALLLSVLLLADMWSVNKRYLNDSNFVEKREMDHPFAKTYADDFILNHNTDHSRVLNLTANVFNDAGTSYFHHSIGGYHGAKMKRYQELIEHHISGEMNQFIQVLKSGATPNAINSSLANLNVLNMLNTKYLIYNAKVQPIINPYALGSAWFIHDLHGVKNADEEIKAIGSIDPSEEAIYDPVLSGYAGDDKRFEVDSSASIKKESYTCREVVYNVKTSKPACAVFSEIYYPYGWDAYIDGKPVQHFRVNYILRAMELPAGQYELKFRFEPKGFVYGTKVTLVSSFILLLLIIGYIGAQFVPLFKRDGK